MKALKPLIKDDYKPLYIQLADRIIEYIKENELNPGDLLPSQNELAEYYGISGMTIRHTMLRLTTEGIVERIRGVGTFVAHPKIREHIEGIQSLEERLAKLGKKVRNTFLEAQEAYPSDRESKDLDLPPGGRTLRIRRLKLMDDTVFAMESRHIPLEIAARFSQQEIESEPFLQLFNRYDDIRVGMASYITRAALLTDFEADAMKVPPDRVALNQYGVFYNRKGRPVMIGRLTYLADTIELQYKVEDNSNHINPIA
ncbi:MAG: GntR family transcriptional regulator [Desulfobacteraceae bacterium]|jgi:GntR family transcriptional regulator